MYSTLTPFTTIVFTLFISINSQSENQQRYTVYSQENCEGESETFTSSRRHLNHVNTSRLGYFGKVKSRRVFSGVWREFTDPNFGGTQLAEREPSIVDANYGAICRKSVLTNQNFHQHMSIRMAGNPDVTAVGLSLFTGSYFSGEELYFDGSRLSLPSQQTFESWGFTGNGDWTFFERTDFMGESNCLRSTAMKINQDETNIVPNPVIYNTKTFIVVGSLYRGCYRISLTGMFGKPLLNVFDDSQADEKPGLTLYSYQTHLFNIGNEVRLPRSRMYTSYSFRGTVPRNWTVFETAEDAEEKRFPICVIHDGTNKTRPEDLMYSFKHNLQIVGVKEGCVNDPGPPSGVQRLRNSASNLSKIWSVGRFISLIICMCYVSILCV